MRFLKKFFILFLLLLLPTLAFAQNNENILSQNTEITPSVVFPACEKNFSLTGPRQVRVNTSHEYGLQSEDSQILPFGKFIVEYNNETAEYSAEREKLPYTFTAAGKAKITLKLDKNVHQCEGDLTTEIEVFSEQVLYLGADRSELSDANMSEVFREKSVLFEPIFVGNNFKIEDQPAVWNSLANADIVVLATGDSIGLFSDIEKLQRLKEISFSKKRFYIISHYQKNFLSKVLASSLAHLKIENISLISSDQFNTLLNKWSYGDDRSATLGERLSYEKSTFAFTMNSFLEYLAYAGVSYQFLGFLLALAVVAVVFNIFKQVIGFDVFSIYYPMLLAIIASQMGLSFSVAFIALAVLAFVIVKFISEKIQLLFNAKKSFLISVYILLVFLALGFDNIFGLSVFRSSMFESPLAIIAIFTILFIVEKIIENIKIFSKSGVFLIVQYIFIVAIAYFILQNTALQYFLISYPDLIFVIVIVNFMIGRYMGLQIVEYIRFLPILKSLDTEEE